MCLKLLIDMSSILFMLRLALMTNVADFSFLKTQGVLFKVIASTDRLLLKLRRVWKTANEFVLENGFA